MTTNTREKSLVVIQLTGGNDYLNTVVPHGSGLYYDSRPVVHIDQDRVLPINDQIGFAPALGPIKDLWDKGNVAVVNGIGYFNPNRSHFRSMDIWHTAEPDAIGTEGWLGRATRDLDPHGENVLTTIHFGRGLPRALGCRGVPVASVGDLQTYGLYPDLQDDPLLEATLECFSQMYSGAVGRGAVLDYIGQTGSDALKGADILRTAPAMYSSSVGIRPRRAEPEHEEHGPSDVCRLGHPYLLHGSTAATTPTRENWTPTRNSGIGVQGRERFHG